MSKCIIGRLIYDDHWDYGVPPFYAIPLTGENYRTVAMLLKCVYDAKKYSPIVSPEIHSNLPNFAYLTDWDYVEHDLNFPTYDSWAFATVNIPEKRLCPVDGRVCVTEHSLLYAYWIDVPSRRTSNLPISLFGENNT